MVEVEIPSKQLVRRFALGLCLFLSLPSCFLVAYVWVAHAPTAAISTHAYVVALLYAMLLGLRLFLALLPLHGTARRVVTSVLITSSVGAALALYAGVFIGLKYWGRVPSVDLVSTYLKQLPALLAALGYHPLMAALTAGSVALLSLYGVYQYLLRFDWAPAVRARVSLTALAIAGPGLIAIFSAGYFGLEMKNFGNDAEPLSLFLFPDQWRKTAQSHGNDVLRAAALQREQNDARLQYAKTERANRSNVILVVSDALRADHLSLFNYSRPTSPQLERLHRQGSMSLATSALSVCNESFCGMHGLVSSQYVEHQSDRPLSLHEVLRKHGYKVHQILSGDHVNFYGINQLYGPVDTYFDGASQSARYVNDDRVVLDRLSTMLHWDGSPVMIQFHLMSSHALGQRFPDSVDFGPGDNYTAMRFGSSIASMPQQATNFYDKGVRQADQVIAQVLGQLKQKGYLENALVIITGDHGESLGERGLYSHTHSVFEEALRVPFLVLTFGKADLGRLQPRSVISQIDIAPTVVHALGIQPPTIWQGAALQVPTTRRFIDFQQVQRLGLVDVGSDDHLYKHWVDTRTGKSFTFDLKSDPGEKVDIGDQVPPQLLREWREHLISKSGALDYEAQKALRKFP